MGILQGEEETVFLIDDSGIVVAYPYQLFEITDNKINSNWFYTIIPKSNSNYPYQQFILGYYELCFSPKHYEKLVEMEDESLRIYFKRKIEIEKEFTE